MHLIDGRALADRIQKEVQENVSHLGFHPNLGVLLVGDDPASRLYVALKKKHAEQAGIVVDLRCLPAATSDQTILAILHDWNQDTRVHAILMQLPLPEGHQTDRLLAEIPPEKDVDGFLPNSTCIPPVHEGILRLINETPLRLNGTQAVLIVNSKIFSSPLERLLKTAGASTTIMEPDAIDDQLLLAADLVVIAVGRARFLRASMTKPDAVIIDVGTNKTSEGKTIGDVDVESYMQTDAWISPVPGGVGPMTIAHVLKNTYGLAASASSSASRLPTANDNGKKIPTGQP